MEAMDKIVEVQDLSIRFRLYKENVTGLKEMVIKRLQGKLAYDEFYALRHVTFDIERGSSVGLIGQNGSGKSTLLKTVAGVLKPTEGKVLVHGKVAPMIELGAGFDMELTAKENVFLNGAILGYPRELLEENLDAIIDYAELREFMDVPIKNFSSGMFTRLGFSIATFQTPDILICDEILAVGDERFQGKCLKRINKMLDNGTTLFFVSHSMEQVRKVCEKAVFLDHGNMIMYSDVNSACDKYKEMMGD